MTNARINVAAPAKELLPYGLFSVVERRRPSGPDGNRWQNGVTWSNVCPDASTTYDSCILGNALGVPVTGVATPADKAETAERSFWGATPFTVLVEIDCSPPGYWLQADEIVRDTFQQAEQYEVESVFYTGSVAGTAALQYPHLAAAAAVTDSSSSPLVTLQLQTGNLGPTGGGALDVVEALGKLERSLATCVRGTGVIHVNTELLAHLKAQHLVHEDGGVYYTCAGNKVAVSAAYLAGHPSTGPQVGVSWMYGTGPVFMYSSEGRLIGDTTEAFDRGVDTLKRIYERTYVLGFDCCLFAVPVSTGGVVTGTINSAT